MADLRMNGITVHPTGETRFCRKCGTESPTYKSVPIQVGNNEVIDIMCERGHIVDGYKLVKPKKKKAGSGLL
jgi:RNase P subunit RPR2